MKLNKTELTALTTQICKELREAAKKKQNELNMIQDEQNTPAAKLALRSIRTMNKTLRAYLDAAHKDMGKVGLSEILPYLRKTQTEVSAPSQYCDSSVFNALVIAQIDSPDVVSLIEKVKAPFITTKI